MKKITDDATAIVEFSGLGIAAFSTRNKRFENAILRHGNHKLKIAVSGPVTPKGKNGEGTRPFNIEIKEVENVEISITTIGKPETRGFKKHTPGKFSRLATANDPNDLRWILNFGSELHGNKLVKNTAINLAQKPPVSRLYIENAFFFAKMPEPKDTHRQPFFIRNDVQTGFRTPFGFMAETIVGRIKAESVILQIKTPKKTWIEQYDHVEGKPFRIEIANVDVSKTASPNEVDILYNFLEDPNGRKYDLEAWVPYVPKNIGKSTSGMNYCHVSDGDGDGIDDFLP